MCGGRQGRKSNFLFSPNLTSNDTCTHGLTLLPHGSHQLEQRTITKRDNRTLPKKEQIWIWEKETKLSKRAPNTENAPPSLVFKKQRRKKNLSFCLNFNSRYHKKIPLTQNSKMSTAKTSSKKRVAESLLTKPASKFRVEDEFDPDLSRYILKTPHFSLFMKKYTKIQIMILISAISRGLCRRYTRSERKLRRTVWRRTSRRFLG